VPIAAHCAGVGRAHGKTGEPADDQRRPAGELAEIRVATVGDRCRAGNPARRQMRQQLRVERELGVRHLLEEGQDVFAAMLVRQEEVRVLHALGNPFERLQRAQRIVSSQAAACWR
jgi:hypothetical protein